jgi:hypothetical protein
MFYLALPVNMKCAEMGTLEARGVVAGFLLLATNVPISAVYELIITPDRR